MNEVAAVHDVTGDHGGFLDLAFGDGDELNGEHPLAARSDFVVGREITLIRIPLNIGASAHVLDVVQTIFGILYRPGVVHTSEGHAGIAGVHTQLLSLTLAGQGEGAASTVGKGPDLAGLNFVKGIIGVQGHVNARIIEPGVVSGQSLTVAGNIEDIIAVGNGGLHGIRVGIGFPRARHFEKLEGEHSLTARGDGAIAAPIALGGIPLHVDVSCSVFDVIQAVPGILQHPLVVLSSQRHTGISVTHTNVLAVMSKAPTAVLVGDDRPHVCVSITCDCVILYHRYVGAGVVVSVICGGKSLVVGWRVNHHMVAIGDGRLGGLFGLDGVLQHLYLAPHAVQNGSGFQSAILIDGNGIAIKIRICGSILIGFNRGIAAIQRIVDDGALGRAGQFDCGTCLHLTRLGLGLRRGDGGLFLGAALAFSQLVQGEGAGVSGRISRNCRVFISPEFVG